MVGVNDGEFPEDVDGDFKGATWYLNNREPVLEARTQLQSLADAAGGASTGVDVDAALREAHIEYVCERMRLLYVGVTRARRHLVLSFSKRGAGGGGRERALAPAVRVMQARGRMSR
jgi:DNA helicase-2/ATP-dependent DNA helicase PcrA